MNNLLAVFSAQNYAFFKGDIVSPSDVQTVFEEYGITDVIHLAAESHVDRSIEGPMDFVMTNVIGTVNLLNTARAFWKSKSREDHRFYHISTDEVYGSLGRDGLFTEKTAYDPHSPYSASKASSDHFVRAYHDTYGIPVVISNCSNNYGPFQFPEKLIPLAIHNIINNKDVPVYGQGENVRDWLFVEDHAKAIDLIFHKAETRKTYNIGGHNEWKNIDLIHLLCRIMDQKLNRSSGTSASLIRFVKDRAGHDLRYAIDAAQIQQELGWTPSLTFETGLEQTVDWYLANTEWLSQVTSGTYLKYYEQQYHRR